MQQGDNNNQLDAIRHTLAHLLAMAALKKFPQAKLGIGPTIEHGFYYDFKLPRPLVPEDLKEFENEIRTLIAARLPVRGEKITAANARKFFKGQSFKLDLIKDFVREKKPLTIYAIGEIVPTKAKNKKLDSKTTNYQLPTTNYFVDLCKGGHVKNTGEIDPDAFALTAIAGAYWKGSEKNPQLQRIYGIAFATKEELQKHLAMLEEAKKRDHRKLGLELDLFTFSELVGGGLPLWTPKGTLLRDTLDNKVWELRKKHGYERVDIPHIAKKELYETSGHWEKFKDELFKIKTREEHLFAMKPMNCPHHTQIYKRRSWSYRELPQRYASTTKVYRDEQTGELSGLSRVRSITQDDAHVFCRTNQAIEEMEKIWDIINEFYTTCGFQRFVVCFSRRDPKRLKNYLGNPKIWNETEKQLMELITKKRTNKYVSIDFNPKEGIGEAAFYGPKVDFILYDSLGRRWQVATIQLDMNLPERFDLSCINESGEAERIVMIHAAIMGSIERFLALLIEHTAGAFPFWLAPVQVAILPINDKNETYIKKIEAALTEKNIRYETDRRNESIGKKIREAELQKIPFLLVVGGREVQHNTVALRKRGAGDRGAMPLEKAIQDMLRS